MLVIYLLTGSSAFRIVIGRTLTFDLSLTLIANCSAKRKLRYDTFSPDTKLTEGRLAHRR